MSPAEIRATVDQQVSDYDISWSDAIENVSDELNISFDDCSTLYLSR